MLLTFSACKSPSSSTIETSLPAGSDAPIVILISLDGFRWDYLQKFKPPHLSKLAVEGVEAERLISAFPSLTFPNHYTIATGLWPEHHGIIANSFYDDGFKTNFNIFNSPAPRESRWWGGEPIWVTALKQGRIANCMFWPGSDAPIQDVRPNQWRSFDYKVTLHERVQTVLDWLGQPVGKRPDFISLYFHETDSAAHHYGIDSAENTQAVFDVDKAVGQLVEGIHRLKLDALVNLVIVSDHGMAEVSATRIVALSRLFDLKQVQVDFSGAVAGLRPLDGDVDSLFKKISAQENHFRVYRRENMPTRFHFRENGRIPPVVLVAHEGWYIRKQPLDEVAAQKFEKATHGFDPELSSMGATFIANGPAFRRHTKIAAVENIHIYNLLCATLGLRPAPNDGDDRLVEKVLKKKSAN